MYNTRKRQAATTDFQKAFHKLLNNACFGMLSLYLKTSKGLFVVHINEKPCIKQKNMKLNIGC